jgi:hypothetical protein
MNKQKPKTTAKERGLKTVQENEKLLDFDHWESLSVKRKGFKSYPEYLDFLAKSMGFKSASEYKLHILRSKGYRGDKEYKEFLAKRKGLERNWQHDKDLALERSRRPRNQKLAELINGRMKEMGMRPIDLQMRTGIPCSRLNGYRKGYFIPKKKNTPEDS